MGIPIVTMNSFLVCRHGGLIEPLTFGQEYEEKESQEIQNLERDKEVLSKLAGAEGLGIDLINDPEEYIKTLSSIVDEISVTSKNRKLLNKVMADVYRAYELGQLKNIDIDSNEFAEIVNKLVKNSGYPDETVHYFRNIMNEIGDILDNLNDMLKLVEQGERECLPAKKSLYHMHGEDSEYNLKFVSKNGLFEEVYNKEGELLGRDKEPINIGTYNYASPDNFIQHFIYDILPYEQDVVESFFKFNIGIEVGSNFGNVGEEILLPVSLDDETLELVKKYREEVEVE